MSAGYDGPGAGCPLLTQSDKTLERDLDGLLEPVTLGDPERAALRWTSNSAAKLAVQLGALGHQIVDRSVLRLLGRMGFSMQANRKTRERPGVPGNVGAWRRRRLRAPPHASTPTRRATARRVLGGTLATSHPAAAGASCAACAASSAPTAICLLGADLVKDPRVIEAAYDDSAGVTAQFNLNVLHVLRPARVRSLIRSRSNSARAAKTWKTSRGTGTRSPPSNGKP